MEVARTPLRAALILEMKKTMKDDRSRLRVFKALDGFYLMLVHSDGEDLGTWSGPYEYEQEATMAATQQAEQEGFVFP